MRLSKKPEIFRHRKGRSLRKKPIRGVFRLQSTIRRHLCPRPFPAARRRRNPNPRAPGRRCFRGGRAYVPAPLCGPGATEERGRSGGPGPGQRGPRAERPQPGRRAAGGPGPLLPTTWAGGKPDDCGRAFLFSFGPIHGAKQRRRGDSPEPGRRGGGPCARRPGGTGGGRYGAGAGATPGRGWGGAWPES